MRPHWTLIKCLAKGIVRNAGGPFGLDIIGNIVGDAWDQWDNNKKLQEAIAELQSYAQARVEEFLAEIRTSLAEAEAASPRPLTPQERAGYEAWMAQIQGQIQRAWRRPSDPDGKTAPGNTVLRSPADLLFMVPSTLPRFRAGEHVHGYELIRPLGSGGFSDVWLGRDPSHCKPVALKFGLTPDEIRERYGSLVTADTNPLRHETAVLQKLERAGVRNGILQPITFYLKDEHAPQCIVYEYIPDGDLNGVLSDLHHSGKVAVAIHDTAHQIILTLARYLTPCHRANIVHRDLKPANVLFRHSEPTREHPHGELVPILADFGIGGVANREILKATRSTIGLAQFQTEMMRRSHTAIYASPQQAEGSDPDPSDDVYAIGVIWYQLLTGDTLHLKLALPTDWLNKLKKTGVPQGFVDLVGQCMASERESRIPNAEVLATEIQRVLDENDAELQRRRANEVADRAERERAEREQQERQRQAREEQARLDAAVKHLRAVWIQERVKDIIVIGILGIIGAIILGVIVGLFGAVGTQAAWALTKVAVVTVVIVGITAGVSIALESSFPAEDRIKDQDLTCAGYGLAVIVLGLMALWAFSVFAIVQLIVFMYNLFAGSGAGGPEEWCFLVRWVTSEKVVVNGFTNTTEWFVWGGVAGFVITIVSCIIRWWVESE